MPDNASCAVRALGLQVILCTQLAAAGRSLAADSCQELVLRGPPASPWLTHKGPPPADAAIGVLMGSPGNTHHFLVTWADATTSREPEGSLLPTPEPWQLPTLGPLKWPAVFDARHGCAMVYGPRGWGWTPHELSLSLFEEHLGAVSRRMQEEASKPPAAASYVRHMTDLIVLSPQRLRAAPDEVAQPTRSVDKAPVADCSEGGERTRAALAKGTPAGAVAQAAVPVRIVERRGDWAQVILPRPGAPWYRCMEGALIRWEERAAGWARLYRPGPLQKTKLRSWRFETWGFWP